jgi:hypothetical protein
MEVLPTNHALRGVPIPAGKHRIELRYDPWSLRLGIPISAISSVTMAVVFVAIGCQRSSVGERSGKRTATHRPVARVVVPGGRRLAAPRVNRGIGTDLQTPEEPIGFEGAWRGRRPQLGTSHE